jgi:tetratricopeptide (TPR) repeat protein
VQSNVPKTIVFLLYACIGLYAQEPSTLAELRDAVYNNAPIERVESIALRIGQSEGYLALSKKEYFRARAWNEAGNKKMAIAGFEAAIKLAKASMESGEHAAGIYAHIKSLSELVRLKDIGFLMANGPIISPNAKKILELEPNHAGAAIILASAKAYPPPVFGGNPREAIAILMSLIANSNNVFEKDELFDIRTCLGTSYSKLGDSSTARKYFLLALELYPLNEYALESLRKIKP